MSKLQTRQPRGTTTGGQFAAPAHHESGIQLQANPDTASWDAWLDATMPAVGQDLLDSPVPAATADRMLHGILRGVRNSYSSAEELGDTYHQGRAAAGTEIAASLMDSRLDGAGIRRAGSTFLTVDVIDALHDREQLHAYSSGAEITSLRARQLAGHFTSEAVRAHADACASEHEGDQVRAQIHHGRSHAYLAGALKFIQGGQHDRHALDREHAMIRAVIDGRSHPDTIIEAGLRA